MPAWRKDIQSGSASPQPLARGLQPLCSPGTSGYLNWSLWLQAINQIRKKSDWIMVWYSFKSTSQIKTKFQIYIKSTNSLFAVFYSVCNVVNLRSNSKSSHLELVQSQEKSSCWIFWHVFIRNVVKKIKLKHFIPTLAADVSYRHRNGHILRTVRRSTHMTKQE